MAHAIAWIFEALLRLLLPSSGRHRDADAADDRPTVRRRDAPTPRPVLVSGVPAGAASAAHGDTSTLQFRVISGPPDGHEAGMVRPYAIAHEQRCKSRPRVELLCAPHGMVVIR
ncbi:MULTISPECIES: hypothetical protein [Streptomyces]|uniref:Uncharacterized protein n=1 Tax=Streptomyces rhizosphaericus TaxID=114699 RepID=A0A6G4AR29_9ACTN|nr:hypothetical protein [Streptomyces rhizosphaericus]NEW75129.1 hypothetical protein [Streptomyces rhizosphaericus]